MSTSSLSIEDAYKALAKAERRESDQYQQVDSEPHDPQYLSHEERRDTPLLDVIDTEELEDKFGNPNENILKEVDGNQVFKTVGEVKDTYLSLKYDEINSDNKTSPLPRLRRQHGRTLEGERQLLQSMESPSMMLLSLRQSPVEYSRGGRKWVPPFRLRKQLADAWSNVYQVLYNHLQGSRWEYARTCAYSRSCGSSHYHVVVWVDDPSNALSIDTARSAVNSYVRANQYADKRHHSVTEGESDAGIVTHSPEDATEHVEPESLAKAHDFRGGGEYFPANTAILQYCLNQHPQWVLDSIWSSDGQIDSRDPVVAGAAVSWASPYGAFKTSRGFPMGGDTE